MKSVILVGLLVITPVVAAAQPRTDTAVARTSWGAPDLQGVWDFHTRTPLERPIEQAETGVGQRSEIDWRQADLPPQGDVGAYNSFWVDIPTDENERTSQVVDPPDGRISPLMPRCTGAGGFTLCRPAWEPPGPVSERGNRR